MANIKKAILILSFLIVPVFIFGITLTPKVSAVNATANSTNVTIQAQIQILMQKIVALMQQLQTLLAQQQTNQTPQNNQNNTQQLVTDLSEPTKNDALYGYLTYANEKYDFEIKYSTAVISSPQEYGPGWHMGLPDVNSYSFAYNTYMEGQDKFAEGGETRICTGSINLGIFDNSSKLSLNDWFAKYGKSFGYSNQVKQEVTVNGIRGIKLGALGALPPSGGNIDGMVLIPRNSLIYTIELNIDQAVIGGNQDFVNRCTFSANDVFNKMASTFKFGDNSSIKPSIEVLLPAESVCVRGKQCDIAWIPSWISKVSSSGKVLISLIKKSTNYNATLNANQDVLLSSGKYSWTIPSTLPAGGSYQLKVCVLSQGGSIDNMPCGLSNTLAIWEHEQ